MEPSSQSESSIPPDHGIMRIKPLIIILLVDVTQEEQTPNLQCTINNNSWATSRLVCKQDGVTAGWPITQEMAEPIEELVGGLN